MADLFTGSRTSRERRAIVATYDYVAVTGELIAQKVRFAPKLFRWRTPDNNRPNGWRWGLDGGLPGLYRLPDLAGRSQVALTEGEKAVRGRQSSDAQNVGEN
jgi:hypothetical protein